MIFFNVTGLCPEMISAFNCWLPCGNDDQEQFLKFISDSFCLIECNIYISYDWRLGRISCHGRDWGGGRGAETGRDCMKPPSPLHGRSTMALHGDHDLTFLASDVW